MSSLPEKKHEKPTKKNHEQPKKKIMSNYRVMSSLLKKNWAIQKKKWAAKRSWIAYLTKKHEKPTKKQKSWATTESWVASWKKKTG